MITLSRKRRTAAVVTLFAAVGLVVGTGASAHADEAGTGTASAFGATISAGGQEVVPPTPAATATLPGEQSETVVDIPADPVAVSGTLNADATVHAASDIESELTQVEQGVPGPYNAAGVALVEDLDVLLDAVEPGVSLVTADVVRAEAVGVCTDGELVGYSANSEIINLQIGGEDVPLNAPLQDVIDGLNAGLAESGLNQVVNIERNVVTELADGIAVDALVVTVLSAAGADPLAQVRIAHAEVSEVSCAEPVVVETPVEPAAPPAQQEALPRTGSDASTTAGLAALMAMGALSLGVIRHRMVS